MTTFTGGWICEAHRQDRAVKGTLINESRTGFSSNRANPGFILSERGADEQRGRVWGFNLVYSGGHMSLDGVLGLSTLSAFVTYAVGIFEPVQILAEDLAEFISLQANIERVTGLLDTEPNVRDSQAVIEKYGDAFHPKRENWEPIRGDIEFRDVTFRYPDGGEDVLSHFDLKIPAGTTVAIVGETGAGKDVYKRQ